MKSKTILFTIFAMLSVSAFGQNSEKGSIGVSFSPFAKSSFLSSKNDASLHVDFQQATAVGINYLMPVSKVFSLETGVEYNLFKLNTFTDSNTEFANDTLASTLSLIEIPVAFRVNFAEVLFFTSGILFDFDMNSSAPISKQSGIGLMAGLGLKYDFKMGLSLFANPFVKLHSLIPFNSWKNHQRIMDAGVRVGVMYRL